jgi:hypothetical protein
MQFAVDERRLKESALWDHMRTVVGNLLQERPAHPMAVIDSISTLVTEGSMLPPPKPSAYKVPPEGGRAKEMLARDTLADAGWARKYLSQVITPKPPAGKEGDEPPPDPVDEPDKGELPDIVQEQEMFNEVGEGISLVEAYRVMVSLKRLLDKEPLGKVRFWGKIIGLKRDYYVCEAKVAEDRLGDVAQPDGGEAPEISGKAPDTIYKLLNGHRAPTAAKIPPETNMGVNEFRYYVATADDISEWVLLPDVLPEHILAARNVHKFFTGNLDSPVLAHPPFPGVEKHYLRAQIARISHSCTIGPKGIFTAADDREPEEKAKRFEVKPYTEVPALTPQADSAPAADDPEAVAPVATWFYGYKDDALMEPSCWQHLTPQLLQTQGRATEFKPEVEGDPEEGEPQPIEYINPMLSEVSYDKEVRLKCHSIVSLPAWNVRKAHHTPSDITRTYLAKSVAWPGAMCVARVEDNVSGATSQNLYIGRGTKSRVGLVYAPGGPGVMLEEFPVTQNRLQVDCSRDDELEFLPPPPPPPPVVAEDEPQDE